MYYVYGDYGYASETLLREFDTLTEARAFLYRYIRRDSGGYNIIEVAQFADDGEYIVHERFESDYQEEDFYYDDQQSDSCYA